MRKENEKIKKGKRTNCSHIVLLLLGRRLVQKLTITSSRTDTISSWCTACTRHDSAP